MELDWAGALVEPPVERGGSLQVRVQLAGARLLTTTEHQGLLQALREIELGQQLAEVEVESSGVVAKLRGPASDVDEQEVRRVLDELFRAATDHADAEEASIVRSREDAERLEERFRDG
jgi:hypothetical protein